MSPLTRVLLALAVLCAGGGLTLAASPPPVQTEALRTGRFTDDLYVAGRTVEVDARVEGDVVAAGSALRLAGSVTGDALLAGGRVTVEAEVADDVRAAGGDVVVSARVGEDLVAAAGRLAVLPSARVGGRARLAGGEVEVAGHLGRGLEVYGREVRLSGEVAGDVEVVADSLEVLPSARVGGTLFHATRRPPRIAPEAHVGRVAPLDPATDWRAEAISRLHGWRAEGVRALGMVGWATFVAAWPALLVTGLVALLAAPRLTLAAARTVASDPGKSLGLGFVTAVVAPALAIVLLATVVGLWLGLALLALYPVALLAGLVVGVAWLGDLLARTVTGPGPTRLVEAGGFAVAVVLLALLSLVPYIGGWLPPLVLLLGLGAIGVAIARTVTGARPAAAHAT